MNEHRVINCSFKKKNLFLGFFFGSTIYYTVLECSLLSLGFKGRYLVSY